MQKDDLRQYLEKQEDLKDVTDTDKTRHAGIGNDP